MISERHRTVFVHVPKTAGQSIEHVFLELHGLTWEERGALLLRPNDDPAKGPPFLAHLRARQYVELGHVSAEDWADWFTFGFVRNPFDRLVSEYRYLGGPRRVPFPEWARTRLARTGWSDLVDHLEPQASYLLDDDDEPLVDAIGRFEQLAEDFAAIAARIGLPSGDLPHRNASRHRPAPDGPGPLAALRRLRDERRARRNTHPHWTAYYDDATRELVAATYARDLEAFGYRFEEAPAVAG